MGTPCNNDITRNDIATPVPSNSSYTTEKDSKRIKKCVALEAARCDQKWTFRLVVGMVVRISYHTHREVLNIDINRSTEHFKKKL